ncbi:MAG: chalcone isomerase family protein [Myxococcota bacterium]
MAAAPFERIPVHRLRLRPALVRRRATGLLALLAACLFALPGSTATLEGVRFAERVDTGDVELSLHGLALHRYRWVIKAYVAALYLEDETPGAQALEDVPKRLELEYFWNLRGQDIAEAGDAMLRENVDDATLATLGPRLRQLNALYEDVAPGDRYSLTYVPGNGTVLAKNDVPLGSIPGADFASAYFAIWLGESPLDASVRDALLTGR